MVILQDGGGNCSRIKAFGFSNQGKSQHFNKLFKNFSKLFDLEGNLWLIWWDLQTIYRCSRRAFPFNFQCGRGSDCAYTGVPSI
jgi:hypothetical protein